MANRQVFTRQKVGLRTPNLHRLTQRTAAQSLSQHRGFTDHWTGADGTLYKPDPIERLRGIQAYHMDTLGYGDIAYHAAYDGDGNIYFLREHRWVGAHAASPENVANIYTDGLVFLEDKRGMTTDGVWAWAHCRAFYRMTMGRDAHTYAHEYWGRMGPPAKPTECPGPYIVDMDRFFGGTV